MTGLAFSSLGRAGAAGSGAAAGAAGASAAIGPAGLALSLGFGVLGFAQARRQNKFLRRQAQFVRESALASFKALNKTLTQIRTQALDNGLRISTEAQIEAGRAEAAFGGVSGVSVSTMIASFASDVASDTAVIRRNRDAMLDAVDAQKQDVFREASNQISQIGAQQKNPVIAGILAGIGGLQAGISLDSAIGSAAQLKKMKELNDRLGTATSQTGALALANSVILRNGQEWVTAHSQRRLEQTRDPLAELGSSVKALRGPG